MAIQDARVLVQSFVIIEIARISTANFASWTRLFPLRPVVTVKGACQKAVYHVAARNTDCAS